MVDQAKYERYKALLVPTGVFALPMTAFNENTLTHVLLILENTKPKKVFSSENAR
jgi:hypothetical protein